MKQTSIPAPATAFAALASLAALGALGALASPAGAQGSTSTQIPDCVLQCRPWLIEPTTIDCEVDCLAKEFEIEFLMAAAAGDPYVPRFSTPDCTASSACPYGAESFTYQTGATVVVGAGLWSTATSFWMPGPAGVVQVSFHAAPVGSVVGVADMAQLPWVPLPTAFFDPGDGFWKCPWPTAGFDDPAGYFLRVDMLDSLLGPVNAYTLAVDPTNCGFHSYGELAGGANKLELSASGTPCTSHTALLSTKSTTAPEVYTAFALAGDYLPLLQGTVLVDIGSQLFVLKTPTSGGVAQQPVFFPPTPGLSGLSIFTQSLAFDAAAPLGVAFSNGLRIVVCVCP